MFEIKELIDPSKNCAFSLVDENYVNHATLIINNKEATIYFEDGSTEESYYKDYDSMLERINELNLKFIKVVDGNSRWKEYNPNPKKRNTHDCTIRAYCKAFNLDWNDAYDLASSIGKELGCILTDNKVVEKVICEHFGKNVDETYNKSKIKAKDRIDVNTFAMLHPYGTYIAHVRGHLVTIVDGLFYDTWDSGKKKIDTIYIIDKK